MMRQMLERLIEEGQELNGVKAAEVQLFFKNSTVVPTLKGPQASNVAAGALMKGPVEGTFCLLTKGEGANRQILLIELLFEADQIFRVDRVKGQVEESRIVPANGPLTMPRQ